MEKSAYLSLGSNLGDRSGHVRSAIAALRAADLGVTRASSLYETEPVDFPDQPWFVNCVVEVETNRTPQALLRCVQEIEAEMGSRKEFPKGPRVIDLDILLYDEETVATPDLQIPHARMHLRRFVLVPLAEIVPALTHPAWKGTVADLLTNLADASQVRYLTRW